MPARPYSFPEEQVTRLRNIFLFLYLVPGCCLALQGQDAPLPQESLDLPAYESFFLAVSRLTPGTAMGRSVRPGRAPTFNGQTTTFVQPELEDALGITVGEAQVLRAIATDCAAKSLAIHQALKPLVLELRFAALAEEARPPSVSRRYNELNRQRAQMVLDHVQELRTAFGETRFRVIETFLSARKHSESFFPAVPRVASRSVK
jgi:hypothetical protein